MYYGKSGYYILQNPLKIVNKNSLILMSVSTVNETLGMNFVERGGKIALIKYKSKLEEQFLRFLDTSSNIIAWGYEVVVIPYMFNGKSHKYHVDLYLEMKDGRKEIWEVKPMDIIKESKDFYGTNMEDEYLKNKAKWQYAREWGERNNIKFRIISE